MIEGLLSDALGSAVGAFDAVGKELRRRFPGLLPPTPHNLFQNVEVLSAALGKATERSLAEALGEEQCTSLTRMFQVRHVYEHSLGVVDAQAINKVPGLAAWRGRKYVLARREVESFLQSLSEAYDAVVRLLEATSSRRASQRGTAPASRLEGTAVRPRSRDLNTKDDRTDVFGIPYKPPERAEAVAQYQRRVWHA